MSSSRASVRTVLPLAIVTCTSMLAMDFYLPAVPSLQAWFGTRVWVAQTTIAVFLLGLAASQLVWAELLVRWGPRASVRSGVTLLAVASVAAALSPTIEVLILCRLAQGVGAGSATVVAPSVVRATLSGSDAVRGIAAISMVEALVPAIGPVLGVALLAVADWRATFWVIAAFCLAALPFALRATPRELPGLDRSVASTYAGLLTNRRYVRLAVSHALSMGALLTFVASAPQTITHALGLDTDAFAALQVIGVVAFAIFASQAGRIAARLGARRAVQIGAWTQLMLCVGMLGVSILRDASFIVLAIFWFVFCGALAVRGPVAFSEALDVPASQLGRASAIMVLAILLAGALGTQVVAPFIGGRSTTGLLLGMSLACAASLALVIPYPKRAIG